MRRETCPRRNAMPNIKTRGHYCVYALSNISSPDHQVPKTKVDASTWNPFDGVFTSAAGGERKPHLGFYRHVLSHTQKWIRGTIFIDDKVENASSLGIICGDPVVRAREYLSENQMCLISYTSENEPIEDNFAQLLILEATGDRYVVSVPVFPSYHSPLADFVLLVVPL
ncbi:hypothetical protein JB92DRAFT_2889148 [Gautieria morchelliformis]|nr:hypothetical protein JB92DRAFT_2889148 [Gautieria morchelliformis]